MGLPIKDEFHYQAIIDLLLRVRANQSALTEMFFTQMAQNEGISENEIHERFNSIVEKHLEQAGSYLYEKYGSIDGLI